MAVTLYRLFLPVPHAIREEALHIRNYLLVHSKNLMTSHADLVGRLAQLRNIASKVELNGVYVLVQAHLPEKNRFLVETLPHPVTNGGRVKIAVKVDSLQQLSRLSFFDRYPRQPIIDVVKTEQLPDILRDGIIMDMSGVKESNQRENLVFVHSHRMLGHVSPLDSDGFPHPRTTLTDNFLIAPVQQQSIIEFEDICFAGLHSSATNIIFCVKGHSTAFRRCSFQNIYLQVAGSDPEVTENVTSRVFGENSYGTPNVTFENCSFEHETFSSQANGVIVSHDGIVTLLHCVFRNCGVAVAVREGGLATMIHCTIENSYIGVNVMEKAKGLHVLNCTVSKCEMYGILLDWVKDVPITGSRVEHCKHSSVQASSRNKRVSNLHIDHFFFEECEYGINFEMGDYAASISNTTIQNNEIFGVVVWPIVMGNIELKQCHMSNNGDQDVMNTSQAQCVVTVDTVKLEPVPTEFEPPRLLYILRCCQRAGVYDILCENCGKKEEAEEKFKKCGKCYNVCYCSRECQKAHWKEHKKVCYEEDSAVSSAPEDLP